MSDILFAIWLAFHPAPVGTATKPKPAPEVVYPALPESEWDQDIEIVERGED